MAELAPAEVLRQVAEAIPGECHEHMVIVGSLAAAYQLRRGARATPVRTKDVDCVVAPRITAASRGAEIAERLIGEGWTLRTEGAHGRPGDATTPSDRLPLVRLRPPSNRGPEAWYIELLTVPALDAAPLSDPERMELSIGHFALRSFRYLPLLTLEPTPTEFGLRCARPEMLALANLLEHPAIKPDTMSEPIAGRTCKRSNKDLGRALAIAWLAGPTAVEAWAEGWESALRVCFPKSWRELASRAGDGLSALLRTEDDLEDAYWTCANGLLVGTDVRVEQLRIAGQRLEFDAVTPLRARAADIES